MELRVIQCQVGQFNLLGNEKSLTFQMGLFEDGKIVEVDGIKAKLYYSGEPDDEYYFRDAKDNLRDIFERCYKYADKVISSTDYGAQCVLFAKLYSQNYESLSAATVAKRKVEIQKEIDKLQKELQQDTIIPEIWDMANWCIVGEIKKYKKWQESSEKELEQLKEGSEMHIKELQRIEGYRQKISTLESNLIPEPAE